jgi:hypothetical protein
MPTIHGGPASDLRLFLLAGWCIVIPTAYFAVALVPSAVELANAINGALVGFVRFSGGCVFDRAGLLLKQSDNLGPMFGR